MWALLAAICWGIWGLFSGIAQKQGTPLGLLAGVLLFEALLMLPFVGQVKQSFSWALVGAAVFGTAAYGAYFMALKSGGPVGNVVAISALYPAVAVLLALVFLQEGITIQKGIGVMLAIIAIALLTANK